METRLYSPVKRFLEGFGLEVKGEVCGCDLVALDRGTPAALVIGELKLSFTLELVLQAVDRSAVCDEVWPAVRAAARRRGRESDPRARKLCRLLGFGLLAVSDSGNVEVLVEPVPWRPRHDAKRRSKIVDGHRRRKGDPTLGGSTRQPTMTAYRRQAPACAAALARHRRTEPSKTLLSSTAMCGRAPSVAVFLRSGVRRTPITAKRHALSSWCGSGRLCQRSVHEQQ